RRRLPVAHDGQQLRARRGPVTRQLLGAQLAGHVSAEVPKRVDIATAIHHAMSVEGVNDLDLSYTPPFGGPWELSSSLLKTGARGGAGPCSAGRRGSSAPGLGRGSPRA